MQALVSAALRSRLGIVLGVFLALAPLASLRAQETFVPDPNLVQLGAQIWKDRAPCRDCHGAFANSVPDVPQQPTGANLRTTALTADQIAEVIRCGRPGTEMPAFDRLAYTDDRCYGLTAAALGSSVPPHGGPLSVREVNALVNFIEANFVGRGDPTFEECVAFWGEDATSCVRYPHAAGPTP